MSLVSSQAARVIAINTSNSATAASHDALNMAAIMEAMGAKFGMLRDAANQAVVAAQLSPENAALRAHAARRGAFARLLDKTQEEEEVAEEMEKDGPPSDTREDPRQWVRSDTRGCNAGGRGARAVCGTTADGVDAMQAGSRVRNREDNNKAPVENKVMRTYKNVLLSGIKKVGTNKVTCVLKSPKCRPCK